MKRTALLLALAAIVLLPGCAAYIRLENAARNQYHRGDYDAAVHNACASLRHKPTNARVQALLQDALRAAVNQHNDRIAELRLSSDKFRWDGMVADYEALVGIERAVRDLPVLRDPSGAAVAIIVGDHNTDLTAAKQSAADAHYREGVRLQARTGDVDAQKQAALEFRAAEKYVPGFRDAADRFSETRKAGTRRVAILPFEDKSGIHSNYGALTDRIADQITGAITADAGEFVEIVNRDQLQQVMSEQQLEYTGLFDPANAVRLGRLVGAHDILTGRITQILYEPEETVERTVELSDTVRRTVKVNDDLGVEQEREIKEPVSATVIVYTRTASATITGSASIIEVQTAAVRKTEPFEGRKQFSAEWATYTGDKRALGGYAPLCDRPEPRAPTEGQLVSDAVGDASRTLAASLKEFLAR